MSLIRQTKAVLAKQPKNITALFNYAMLLKADKQLGATIQQLIKARKLAPDDLEILAILAETCLEVKNYPLARKYARIACEKFPKNLSCRMFHADVLQQMGKPDLALKQYEIVLSLEPNHPTVLFEMAQTSRMKGNIKGVEALQETLETVDPLGANAIYTEANNRKNTKEDAEKLESRIAQSLEAVEARQTQEEYKDSDFSGAFASLNYSRGKIWSDIGEYDRAFEAYLAANKAADPGWNKEYFNPFKNAKAAFSKFFLQNRKEYGDKSIAPIFIFGMPRSGTTLTESICGAHSKVTAGDELLHIGTIAAGIGENAPNHDAFNKTVELLTSPEVKRMANIYLDKTGSLRTKTPHFTDKMPHNFMRLGLMKLIFPNASFIHVRRHPIDNCLSIFTNAMSEYHSTYKADLTRLGLYYRQYWQLMAFWRENIPGGFHEVYYEDVVANTELNARKMIDYIGLEWEDGVANRQKSQKSVRTLSAWQVRQPVYTSSAGRWKNYEKHLKPLIDALGPLVEEYETELAALDKEEGAAGGLNTGR
ncbi:MAG: sulfotransferase [Salaquimonas sp.]